MLTLRASLVAFTFVCLSTVKARAQAVHVLTNGTGTALQAAIDAALDGDTILMHAGSFANVHMSDKSLTLVSEPAQSTTIQKLAVDGLSLGKRVVLSNLRLQTSDASLAISVPVFPVAALKLVNCAGSVRIQDTACLPFVVDSGADAVLVSNSGDVAFLGCQIQGGHHRGPSAVLNGAQYFGPGNGLSCNLASRIALYDSDVRGGNGANGLLRGGFGSPNVVNATAGARGMIVNTGSAFVANSLLTGGNGGSGIGTNCSTACGNDATNGGAGGSGLESNGVQTLLVDDVLFGGVQGLGGSGGTCSGGSCTPPGVTHPNGADGAPGTQSVGSALTLSGPVASLTAPTLVREQHTFRLSVSATPGDIATLAISTDSRWIASPALQGVYLFGPDVRRFDLGLVPPSGTLTLTLSSGTLPVGVETFTRVLQVATRDSTGATRLGGARVLTIVGQGF